MREEPAGSGRVVVLGRAHQDREQGAEGAEEFGEWVTTSPGDIGVRSP